jgi:hypothetical protein
MKRPSRVQQSPCPGGAPRQDACWKSGARIHATGETQRAASRPLRLHAVGTARRAACPSAAGSVSIPAPGELKRTSRAQLTRTRPPRRPRHHLRGPARSSSDRARSAGREQHEEEGPRRGLVAR